MKAIPVLVAGLLGFNAADSLAQQRAQPVTERGFYLLFGAGRAHADIDNGALDAAARSAGFATSGTTSDDKVSAWKLALGYQFTRHLAVEVSYADFDNFKTSTTTTGPAAVFDGRIDGKAYSLDVVGIVPVTPAIDLFGKVGAHRWDVDTRAIALVNGTTVGSATASADGTDWKFGLGARWNFNRNLGVQFEWERYNDVGNSNVGRSDIDMLTVGLRWKF